MSDFNRYDVYVPAGKFWSLVFSVPTVLKPEGAVDRLYDTVVPVCADLRVAVVVDTQRNRHVSIYRKMRDNDTIELVPAKAWTDGVSEVIELSLQKEMESLAEIVSRDIVHDTTESAALLPDQVLLTWYTPDDGIAQYVIKNPTERQVKVLRAANGCIAGVAEVTEKQTAAVNRISLALSASIESCQYAIDQDVKLEKWACIWKDTLHDRYTQLILTGVTEIITTGVEY